MQLLKSIEEVELHHVYNTGCRPLLVHCNDLEYYVCKYNNSFGSADRLLREYIAGSFLQRWNIPVPDFNLVQLQQEHIPSSLGIGRVNFDCPCFGSLYNRSYKEVDVFLSGMSDHQKRKFSFPENFLAIAFFDIWASNDDRHQINYNLLISSQQSGYIFVPIDHESCFHTGNQGRENYTLSWDESLLSSPLLTRLFKIPELTDQTFLAGLKSKWYLCSRSCKSSLHEILSSVPQEWLINPAGIEGEIISFMFSDEWFEECWKTFLEHIQVTINH